MSQKLYEETNIAAIATAIREKNGAQDTYTPVQMAEAIRSIRANPVMDTLLVSHNGIFAPSAGVDGFNQVIVTVEGSATHASALHVWTKSTGSGDAALYIQSGYIDDIFVADGALMSLIYTDATDGIDYAGIVHIRYGSPSTLSWNIKALVDIVYNNVRYERDTWITSWRYDSNQDTIFGAPSEPVPSTDDAKEIIEGNASVVINSSVNQIREFGFYNYSRLQAVAFEACSIIGSSAFTSCSVLSSIYFPSCTQIGNFAFDNCSALLAASFPACINIGDTAFRNCSSLSNISFPVCTTIQHAAFNTCINLSAVVCPECTFIGGYAFVNCSSLSVISCPSCSRIEEYAFASCSSLLELALPACSWINSYAFGNCHSLATVDLPSCKYIGPGAFQFCSTLQTVSLPEGKILSNNTFQSCISISEISFPACTSIGAEAFRNCSALTTVSLPFCMYISNSAFMNDSALTTIFAPACISIGQEAFRRCSALTNVSFGAIRSMGQAVFMYCSSLSSVYFNFSSTSIPTINTNVFQQTPMSDSSYLGYFGSIYVPESLVATVKSITGWSVYADRITGYTPE